MKVLQIVKLVVAVIRGIIAITNTREGREFVNQLQFEEDDK